MIFEPDFYCERVAGQVSGINQSTNSLGQRFPFEQDRQAISLKFLEVRNDGRPSHFERDLGIAGERILRTIRSFRQYDFFLEGFLGMTVIFM